MTKTGDNKCPQPEGCKAAEQCQGDCLASDDDDVDGMDWCDGCCDFVEFAIEVTSTQSLCPSCMSGDSE